MVKEKTRPAKKNSVQRESIQKLVLYNDDVNTFDHVIECLIDICNHEPEQAEQCAVIVHTKGKCAIKLGDYDFLYPMNISLSDRGLSVTIENN